jgi:hypothetical protein
MICLLYHRIFSWAETAKQRDSKVKFSDKYGSILRPASLGCDVVDLIAQQPANSTGSALRRLNQYNGTIGKVSSSVGGLLEFQLYPVSLKGGG